MEGDLPFQKIAIPGPTLASIIQRSISAPCDIDGLLFGHVTRLTPSSLSDDSSSSSELLIPNITSFLSFSHPLSFYDPLGRVHLASLRRAVPSSPQVSLPNSLCLLGFFVARRNSPLRPSMRELSVSHSLLSQILNLDDPNDLLSSLISPSSPPTIFLLLSSSPSTASSLSVHSHDYRAFQLRPLQPLPTLEPCSLDIVNIGPAFRPHYSEFSPIAPFPWLPLRTEEGEEESLERIKQTAKEQRGLVACTEGFEIGRLSRLMGSEATGELEDLYGRMLAKLEGLARAVEKSSARVLEQEDRNIKLRCKVAGSE